MAKNTNAAEAADRFINALGRWLPDAIAWPLALLTAAVLCLALGRVWFYEWMLRDNIREQR